MGVFSKAGNHATAAVFARRLIDSNPSVPTVITQVSYLPPSSIDRWFSIDRWKIPSSMDYTSISGCDIIRHEWS
jgi:hypothetical protein